MGKKNPKKNISTFNSLTRNEKGKQHNALSSNLELLRVVGHTRYTLKYPALLLTSRSPLQSLESGLKARRTKTTAHRPRIDQHSRGLIRSVKTERRIRLTVDLRRSKAVPATQLGRLAPCTVLPTRKTRRVRVYVGNRRASGAQC